MSVRDDSEGAVNDDSNSVDTLRLLDIAVQRQTKPRRPENMSNRQCEHLEAKPHTLPNLMEDSLLQLSPRISIPRKQMAAVRSKQQTKEMDKALDEKTNVSNDFEIWLFIYFHLFVMYNLLFAIIHLLWEQVESHLLHNIFLACFSMIQLFISNLNFR